MQQRYYEPIAGRFLSVDPVTTDSGTGGHFNRYVYGNNNPYRFTDPDGREPHPVIDRLFPRGDIVRAAGESIGALAAYAHGAISGNEALKAAALEGMRDNVSKGDAVNAASVLLSGRAGGREVPNSAVVCRGGSCTAESFANGKGVTTDPATGKLSGISTGVGKSVAEASANIPHSKVGVTTTGDIRAAGGAVTNNHGNHANVSGITATKAAELFKNVEKNPNK